MLDSYNDPVNKSIVKKGKNLRPLPIIITHITSFPFIALMTFLIYYISSLCARQT